MLCSSSCRGFLMPFAHSWGQVLHTHSLLSPCHPSGHNGFPDPLNTPPLFSWLPGAVSCGSSFSGLSDRGGPLLHHPLSVVRGSSPDLPHPGPGFFVSPGFSSTHTATLQLLSMTPPAGLSCLLCCVLPSQSPNRCSTQFSRLCLRHTLLNPQAPPFSTCYRARLSSPPRSHSPCNPSCFHADPRLTL